MLSILQVYLFKLDIQLTESISEMNENCSLRIGLTEIKFSEVNIVNVADTGMVYPKFNLLNDKEVKECALSYEYTCDEVECNFDSCLYSIRQSSELKSKGLCDTTIIVVDALANNQDLFTVKEVGGGLFYKLLEKVKYI